MTPELKDPSTGQPPAAATGVSNAGAAVDFAYERYGRFVAPGEKLGWLYVAGGRPEDSTERQEKVARLEVATDPAEIEGLKAWLASRKGKAGARSGGIRTQTVVFISEGGAELYGASFEDQGVPCRGDKSAGLARIRSALFRPTRERWLALVFAKGDVDDRHLLLNLPGAAVNGYYTVGQVLPTLAHPSILEQCATLLDLPSKSEADRLLFAAASYATARSAESAATYAEALARFGKHHPNTDEYSVRMTLTAFLESGMARSLLGQYLEWQETHAAELDQKDVA